MRVIETVLYQDILRQKSVELLGYAGTDKVMNVLESLCFLTVTAKDETIEIQDVT